MITHWIENDFDISKVYDPAFVSKKFNLTNREARYYCQKAVDSGMLCKVTIDGNVYYARAEWYKILRKYQVLDNVKIS